MKEIETQRLILRRFQADDWKDLHEYLSDKNVVRFEPYDIYTEEESRKEAINRSDNENFWAVILKGNGKLIGNIYFEKQEFDTWEIGYVFHGGYQGYGYAAYSKTALNMQRI